VDRLPIYKQLVAQHFCLVSSIVASLQPFYLLHPQVLASSYQKIVWGLNKVEDLFVQLLAFL
jgi:hypothetical protein